METREKKGYRWERCAGVLMPISSLPSKEGIGTLGDGAYAFVDWLEAAGMKIWQVLPLLPTSYGDSPYQSYASDALNFYFIDLEILNKEGLLEKSDYSEYTWSDDIRRVDYGKLFMWKAEILKKAYARFEKTDAAWQTFLMEGKYKNAALFMALKATFGYKPWTEWEEPYKKADKKVLTAYIHENQTEIEFWQFTQFLFLKQWNALHTYAKEKGISIMGDMPIYIAYDSVETWKYGQDLFMMDGEGNLTLLAGVPPDAFSEEGQLWGNPIYNWKKMKAQNYQWWIDRIHYAFELFDMIRIDHFRAFDRYYAIPADAETAKEGEWLDGPKESLFTNIKEYAIIAEDLGVIDDGVRDLLKATGYPGMKVFEFAFDGNPENEYLPSQYDENCVVYTGTHDNDTLRYFIESMEKPERKAFEKTLEEECLLAETPYLMETIEDECESVIELLMASKANIVIIPMHDVLCMGKEARLNAPATVSDKNWTFRFIEKDFSRRKAAWLKSLTEEYER